MNEADFKVYQYHATQLMDAPYEPMNIEFANEIRSLDFAQESYVYYRGVDFKQKPSYGNYGESKAALKYEGDLRTVMEKEFAESGLPSDKQTSIEADGNYPAGILGMEPEALPMESENVYVYDGSLDEETFASGDYLIYQPYYGHFAGEDFRFEAVEAGQELTLSFYNYERGEYVERTFTVMAVVGTKPDNYAGEFGTDTQFILPDTVFREIYGGQADDMVSAVLINTAENEDSNRESKYQETLEEMTAQSLNSQIRVSSKYETRMMQETQKAQKVCIGIFVAVIVGLIGIANIVNTLVTGVLSRKIEYAALQSIGMTKRQMIRDIFRDGMKMVLISMALVIPVGIPVAQALSQYPLSTGFVPSLFAAAVCMVLAAGVALSILTSVILTEVLNKKTVVERLREAE